MARRKRASLGRPRTVADDWLDAQGRAVTDYERHAHDTLYLATLEGNVPAAMRILEIVEPAIYGKVAALPRTVDSSDDKKQSPPPVGKIRLVMNE